SAPRDPPPPAEGGNRGDSLWWAYPEILGSWCSRQQKKGRGIRHPYPIVNAVMTAGGDPPAGSAPSVHVAVPARGRQRGRVDPPWLDWSPLRQATHRAARR